MNFEPAKTIADSVAFDPEARALYISIEAKELNVAQTYSYDGVNVDCDRAGRVLGIEVLLNRQELLSKKALAVPATSPNRFTLRVDGSEIIAHDQSYDQETRILRIGTPSGSSTSYWLGNHIVVSASSDSLCFWIMPVQV